MSVLISLVVPTRTRAETLGATLCSAVEQDFDDYEIIVCDNNSEDNTREVVESFGSDKICYLNTGKRLSMCDNWEFALSHVNGEYVVFIGDDDAIMPGGVRLLAENITAFDVDAYTWRASTYQWPIDGQAARFIHDAGATSNPVKQRNLKKAALGVIRRGGWGYYWLPSVYHGAIATRVLREIRSATGRVFHSTQPDLFTALAIPAFVDSFVCLSSPVTLNGRSAKSNGGASVAQDGENVTNLFIKEYGDYEMHSSMPLPPKEMGGLIVDAFLVAKDVFPSLYGNTAFNYSAMWAFLRRLSLTDKAFIYSNREKIGEHHKINFLEFEFYCFCHDVIGYRRKFIELVSANGKSGPIPNNIFDFSKLIAN